jgi:hypothetical protein
MDFMVKRRKQEEIAGVLESRGLLPKIRHSRGGWRITDPATAGNCG